MRFSPNLFHRPTTRGIGTVTSYQSPAAGQAAAGAQVIFPPHRKSSPVPATRGSVGDVYDSAIADKLHLRRRRASHDRPPRRRGWTAGGRLWSIASSLTLADPPKYSPNYRLSSHGGWRWRVDLAADEGGIGDIPLSSRP